MIADPHPRWLLLVRHGQTAWNAEHRFVGTTDVPLDATGHEQAASLGQAMRPHRIAAVFSSPLARAMQTAAYLGPSPSPVADLRELAQGEIEGMRGPEAIERFPDFFARWVRDSATAVVPGGESVTECCRRATDALLRLAPEIAPGSTAIAVAHQMVISSVLCAAAGRAPGHWREYRLPNCGASLVEVRGGRIQLVKHRWSPAADPVPAHYGEPPAGGLP